MSSFTVVPACKTLTNEANFSGFQNKVTNVFAFSKTVLMSNHSLQRTAESRAAYIGYCARATSLAAPLRLW